MIKPPITAIKPRVLSKDRWRDLFAPSIALNKSQLYQQK
jgi:hypothetical protein